MLDTGIKLVRSKIDKFEKKLIFLEEMKRDIQRNEKLRKKKDGIYLTLEPTDYWFVPFTGKICTNDYHFSLNQLFKRVTAIGLKTIYEGVIALVTKKQQSESFLFIFLEPNAANKLHENVQPLPKTRYLAKVTAQPTIQTIYHESKELLENQTESILFELEMYSDQSATAEPAFKVRIPIKKQ